MSMLRITPGHALAALLLLPLVACSGADEVARDPGAASSPSPAEPGSGSPGSPGSPDGSGFGPTDYDYTLVASCYCAYAAVPVRVSVREDRVVSAVFAADGHGRHAVTEGEDAPEFLRLSIEDVIAQVEEAEAAGAHEVTVDWPETSDHPLSVWIDREERMVDEEIGYTLSDVKVVGEGIGG